MRSTPLMKVKVIKSSYLIKGQCKFILVVKSQSKYLAGQHFDRVFTNNCQCIDSRFHPVHLSIRIVLFTILYIYILKIFIHIIMVYYIIAFPPPKSVGSEQKRFSQNWFPLQISVPFVNCKQIKVAS